jgi:PAS domain S-box-containing protein
MIQRSQSEERLRESEERFHLLFNQMLVGCTLNEIVCDEHGNPVDRVYLEINPAFESLMGLRRQDVIGKRMREILPDIEPFWIERYGHVALTGQPVRFEGYMRAVDKYFDVGVFSPRRGQFAVTFVDITAMKAMEASLRSLLAISSVLNSTLDIDSLLDSLIVEAIRLTHAEGGCAGLRLEGGMACRRYFRGSEPIPFEYCWPAGVGWPGWVLIHKVPYLTNDALNDPVIVPKIREELGVKSGIGTPLLDTGGKVIGFFEVNNRRDQEGFTRSDLEKLTAVAQIASVALQNSLAYRKLSETEESVRKLWNRLLRVQDEERRRIGRELHDVTGQALSALSMRLGAARRMLGVEEGKVQEVLKESLVLVKECSDAIRSLSYLLHSPVIEESGLESALRPYVEGFSQRSGIRVELEMAGENDRLPREIEDMLFRVVQEGLTNIHLHSEASQASIRVVHNPEEVTLDVSDNGRGIALELLEKFRTHGVLPGIGLASMEERVRQLGGSLEIVSNRQGTAITARVPLKAEET